ASAGSGRVCVARKNVSFRASAGRSEGNKSVFYFTRRNKCDDDVRSVPVLVYAIPPERFGQAGRVGARFQSLTKSALRVHSLCDVPTASAGQQAARRAGGRRAALP